jgi:flagellar motor switch protein FliN
VTETIEYEELGAEGTDGPPPRTDVGRLSEIPMELSVELGRSHMTLGQTLELGVGAVVALERQAGEPVDLLVNGSPIARGEIVVVDEQYGLRITEILEERPATSVSADAEIAPPEGGEPAAAAAEG